MNIFYLDEDIDKCAEYHVDSHVVKMPTEGAQMLTTAIWVDHFLGFVPRALTKEELSVINTEKAAQPSIEERTFTRFLPAHINHPCTIWARSSSANYEWLFAYVDALNCEWQYRYRHDHNHKSFAACMRLPSPRNLVGNELTPRPLCMPDEYKDENVINAYRMYYMAEKADFAVWKRRNKPDWWDPYMVQYSGKDPHEAYMNVLKAPTNKTRQM